MSCFLFHDWTEYIPFKFSYYIKQGRICKRCHFVRVDFEDDVLVEIEDIKSNVKLIENEKEKLRTTKLRPRPIG